MLVLQKACYDNWICEQLFTSQMHSLDLAVCAICLSVCTCLSVCLTVSLSLSLSLSLSPSPPPFSTSHAISCQVGFLLCASFSHVFPHTHVFSRAENSVTQTSCACLVHAWSRNRSWSFWSWWMEATCWLTWRITARKLWEMCKILSG